MSDRALVPKLLRLALPALLTVLVGIAMPTAFAAGKPQRHGQSQNPAATHTQADLGVGDNSAEPPQQLADRVVVRKSERRMYLMHRDSVLRSYRVALGLNPLGPKEQEGDSRTPEGHYVLTRRNPRSEYFLSIQVSYPNDRDMQRARRNRLTPGGSIMIHGLPNELRREPTYYEERDWTDGCIAVSDSDMLEIWLLTPADTPIDILP
jgi:murein L,D-transpeptidase YafK